MNNLQRLIAVQDISEEFVFTGYNTFPILAKSEDDFLFELELAFLEWLERNKDKPEYKIDESYYLTICGHEFNIWNFVWYDEGKRILDLSKLKLYTLDEWFSSNTLSPKDYYAEG